jgi:hypothetical protein
MQNNHPQRVAGTDLKGLPLLKKRGDFKLSKEASDPDHPFVDSAFGSIDEALTHAAGVMVFTLYEGWPWRVWADHSQGCVFIKMDYLMGARDHLIIPIRKLTHEQALYQCVREVCGNFLERFNLPRGAYDQARFVEAIGSIPLHRRGYYGQIPT